MFKISNPNPGPRGFTVVKVENGEVVDRKKFTVPAHGFITANIPDDQAEKFSGEYGLKFEPFDPKAEAFKADTAVTAPEDHAAIGRAMVEEMQRHYEERIERLSERHSAELEALQGDHDALKVENDDLKAQLTALGNDNGPMHEARHVGGGKYRVFLGDDAISEETFDKDGAAAKVEELNQPK